MEETKAKGRKLVVPGSVEGEPKLPPGGLERLQDAREKAERADKRMAGMNLEALHNRIEVWGIAGVVAPLIARGLSGDKLTKAVIAAETAARRIKAELDKLGTEGKA